MTRSKHIIQLALLIVLFSGFAGFNFIKAYSESLWFPPAGAPPTHNVAAPINQASSITDHQTGHGNLAFDQLTAFTRVNAEEYCDLNGENCLGVTSPSIFNTEVKYFETFAGSGATEQSVSLGNWTFCALGKQKTTADDNNIYDGCSVLQTTPGYWSLTLNKSSEDSLTCGAQCMYIGQDRDLTPAITNYSYRWETGAVTSCHVNCGNSCGPTETTGTGPRSVTCVRSDGIRSSDSFCTGAKPASTATCHN